MKTTPLVPVVPVDPFGYSAEWNNITVHHPNEISDLFYYQYNDNGNIINHLSYAYLFPNIAIPLSLLEARIYMGVNPSPIADPLPGQKNVPRFTPVVCLMSGTRETPVYDWYILTALSQEQSPAIPEGGMDLPIDRIQACKFETAWRCHQTPGSIANSVYSTCGYVQFFRVDKEDLDKLAQQNGPVYVNLGYSDTVDPYLPGNTTVDPIRPVDPFHFRFVYQGGETSFDAAVFFEFSAPCPPACILS